MRSSNIVIMSLASTAVVGTCKAPSSGVPQDSANDGMTVGSFPTTDLVRLAAATSDSKPSPVSESTSLKWNEAAKWGVIGIASALIIPLAGWVIRSIYKRHRNRALTQQNDDRQPAQVVANHGQVASVQDAVAQAARQDWIDEARLPLDADPVGLLATDEELQVVHQHPDAPQIPPQDFGDDFVLNKWLRRMPLARLPPPKTVTPPV
ncbi:hypothetical protein HG530_013081 [Fusarium avenaceum]|nr:hypothetical protein HG530_013081 [Fusarium avenaceum]